MCKCTPAIRTPFCGKPECQWPAQRLGDRPNIGSRSRLIEALVKISGACMLLENIPRATILQSACVEAEYAQQYLREAHEALCEVLREAASTHRDGRACIDCRNKVM